MCPHLGISPAVERLLRMQSARVKAGAGAPPHLQINGRGNMITHIKIQRRRRGKSVQTSAGCSLTAQDFSEKEEEKEEEREGGREGGEKKRKPSQTINIESEDEIFIMRVPVIRGSGYVLLSKKVFIKKGEEKKNAAMQFISLGRINVMVPH